jgi:hypothetical protein
MSKKKIKELEKQIEELEQRVAMLEAVQWRWTEPDDSSTNVSYPVWDNVTFPIGETFIIDGNEVIDTFVIE